MPSPSLVPWALDFAAELDRPASRSTRVAAAALAVAVVALIAVGLAAAGRVASLASLCELHEAREGSGYQNQVGLTVDEFRRVVWRPFAVREVASDQAPGTIVQVSRCRAPRGADLVVSVARS